MLIHNELKEKKGSYAFNDYSTSFIASSIGTEREFQLILYLQGSNVTSQSFTVSSKETTASNHTGLPYPRKHLDKPIGKRVPLDLKSEEGKRF